MYTPGNDHEGEMNKGELDGLQESQQLTSQLPECPEFIQQHVRFGA